jgi:hypothetical protein
MAGIRSTFAVQVYNMSDKALQANFPKTKANTKSNLNKEKDCINESPLCHAHIIKPARTFFSAPLRSYKVGERSLLEGRQVLQLLCERVEQLLAASGWPSPSTAEFKPNCRKQLRAFLTQFPCTHKISHTLRSLRTNEQISNISGVLSCCRKCCSVLAATA